MKKSSRVNGMANLLLFIGFVLSACSPAGQPLHITSVKVSPEPIVGEIVTLEIEVMSTNDEADVKFTVDTLEYAGNKLHFVSGVTSCKWSYQLARFADS